MEDPKQLIEESDTMMQRACDNTRKKGAAGKFAKVSVQRWKIEKEQFFYGN